MGTQNTLNLYFQLVCDQLKMLANIINQIIYYNSLFYMYVFIFLALVSVRPTKYHGNTIYVLYIILTNYNRWLHCMYNLCTYYMYIELHNPYKKNYNSTNENKFLFTILYCY